MPYEPKHYSKSLTTALSFWSLRRYWRKGWYQKTLTTLIAFILCAVLTIYGVGQWYIYSQRHIPMTYGVTFVPDYAESLGLNPQQTMAALIKIGVRQFRLTSYWSDIEPLRGQYNFSELDWEFAQADAAHAKVILTVGLRQPRWPECHPPSWINTAAPMSTWEPQLEQFMTRVINRYKNNSALEAYQLENEYFLKGFGDCQNFSRSRLVSEYKLIKKLDPHHVIIVGRSNNAIGFPVGQPQPDLFSISIYKRVWDASVTHRYLEYPFPSWFYSFLAGIQELYTNHNMIIAEMQAEAWPPKGQTILQTPLSEQNKSMNATRLRHRFMFARSTGMKDALMWGAEYWYYRKVILHDPSLWNVAKQEFQANSDHEAARLFPLNPSP